MNFIDLHIHSTASDGTVAPENLLSLIHPEQYNQVVIALTDHDCLSGILPLQRSAAAYPNVTVIPGVEISTQYRGHSVHMLGLGIRPEDPALNRALSALRAGRDDRNKKILEKLAQCGITVPESVIAPKPGQSIGRPLIARYLAQAGYTATPKEAFDRYLKEGACCYVDRVHYSPADSVGLILRAGGTPVLAHPMQYRSLTRRQLEELVADLTAIGLQGIETYYTEFTPEETAFVESLAEKYHLLRTGGSDFHGDNKPTYRLGFGWGNLGATFEKIEYKKISF